MVSRAIPGTPRKGRMNTNGAAAADNVWASTINMLKDAQGKIGKQYVPLAVVLVKMEINEDGSLSPSPRADLGMIWPADYPAEGRIEVIKQLMSDYTRGNPEAVGEDLIGHCSHTSN